MVSVSPTPIESHAIHRDRMLAHAREMLERGDRLQASEKIWGAVAHAVKAVAAERGWPCSHHADGGVIVDYIAERVGDAEMAPLFDSIERAADFPGRLVRWRGGGEPVEVVADGLDSPTAVAVSADGGVYVSDGVDGADAAEYIRRRRN